MRAGNLRTLTAHGIVEDSHVQEIVPDVSCIFYTRLGVVVPLLEKIYLDGEPYAGLMAWSYESIAIGVL